MAIHNFVYDTIWFKLDQAFIKLMKNIQGVGEVFTHHQMIHAGGVLS